MKNATRNSGDGSVGHGAASLEALLEHGDWLRQLARSLVGPGADAMDLMQDTWVAAAGSPPPAGVESRSWLAGIARNLARNKSRSQARRRTRELTAQSQGTSRSADDEVDELEQQQRLLTALMRLPEAHRRVVVGRYYDGEPPRALAAQLDVPVTTIKSHLQRGLAALRRELDEAYGDRKSWSVALTPLAMKASGKGAAGAATSFVGFKVAAALMIALVSSALIFSGWLRSSPEAETKPAAPAIAMIETDRVAPPEAQAADGAQALAAVTPVEKNRTPSVQIAAAGPGSTQIRARHRESGLNVTEFSGWVAAFQKTQAEFASKGIEIDALDQLAPFADPLASDGARAASTAIQGPFLAYVETQDRAGIGFTEDPSSLSEGLVVDLVKAPEVKIQLVDHGGQPVLEDAIVQFEALLAKEGSGPILPGGHLGVPADYRWSEQGVSVRRGVGTARLVFSPGNAVQPCEAMGSVQTRGFHVKAPGVTEFARDTIAHIDDVLQPMPGAKRVVQVIKPALGSLRLELTDEGGHALEVDGRATLRFDDVPQGLRPTSYGAAVKNGVAAWPAIVAGGHALTVELTVPSLGQTWSVRGRGPDADGDAATLEAPLPRVRALTARLVGGDQLALGKRLVHFVYGPKQYHRFVEGRTDTAGNVRFTLPDEGLQEGPFLLELLTGTRCVGFSPLALTQVQIESGGELGEVVIAAPEGVTVKGQIKTPDGPLGVPALVAMTRGGRRRMAAFVQGGAFEFDGPFGEEEILTVHVLLPGEREFTIDRSREPDATLTLRPYELLGPVDVEVAAPQLGATVYASVDVSGTEVHPGDVRFWLTQEGSHSLGLEWDPKEGEHVGWDVPPGEYTAHLAVRGAVPACSWTQVEVRSGAVVRDPRMGRVQLSDLVRSIDVAWKTPNDPETGEPRPPMLVAFRPALASAALTKGARVTSHSPPFALVIPKDLAGTICVSARGFKPTVHPAESVGDSLQIDLEPGFERSISITGSPPVGAALFLRLEENDDSQTGGYTGNVHDIPVPRDLRKGDRWTAWLPALGRYRLLRYFDGPGSSGVLLRAQIQVDPPGVELGDPRLDLACDEPLVMDSAGD